MKIKTKILLLANTNQTLQIQKCGNIIKQKYHVINFLEFKQCQYRFPDVGSSKTKFRYRIKNYKSTHRKFRKRYAKKDLAIVIKKNELKQELFYEHYISEVYQQSWTKGWRRIHKIKQNRFFYGRFYS